MPRARVALTTATVMLLSGFRAQGAPMVGPAVSLDAPPAVARGQGQAAAALAFDGTNYLMVWADGRDGTSPGDGRLLYGARFDRTGAALDPAGFPLTTPSVGAPALAFTRDVFLAVAASPTAVLAVRIDKSGKLLGGAAPLTLANASALDPAVAANGSLFLAVWSTSGASSSTIRAARVRPDGMVLDPVPITVADTPLLHNPPRVASNGSDFLVVWDDDRLGPGRNLVYGVRVAGDGRSLDAQPLTLAPGANGQYAPQICFGGGNYFVSWTNGSVLAAVVSAAGKPLASDIALSPPTTQVWWSRSLACNAGGALVSWLGGSARLDRVGKVLDAAALAVPPPSTAPTTGPPGTSFVAAASDGTDYFLAWTLDRTLLGSQIRGSGVVVTPEGRRLVTTTARELMPAVTYDGSSYLALWGDERMPGSLGFGGVRLDLTGRPAGPASFSAVPGARPLARALAPVLAWNGRDHLAVWGDTLNAGMGAARVDGDGRFFPSVGLAGSSEAPGGLGTNGALGPGPNVAVASDGDGFLAVWTQVPAGGVVPVLARTADDGAGVAPQPPRMEPLPPSLVGARIGANGMVVGPVLFPVTSGGGGRTQPAITFDGADYVVVWAESNRGLRGVHVGRDGTVRDPAGFTIFDGASLAPAIASGSDAHLVAWWNGTTVAARRLAKTGLPLDAAAFSVGAAARGATRGTLSVAWDGHDFLVAWAERLADTTTVSAARVAADGKRLDGAGFPLHVSSGGADRDVPGVSLTSDGKGHWLAVHAAFDPAPDALTTRARAQLITNCTGASCPAAPDAGALPDPVVTPPPSDGGMMPPAPISDAGAVANPPPDGGARDSAASLSADSGTSTAVGSSSGCGCRLADAPGAGGGASALVTVLCLAFGRRRRLRR